MRNAAARIIVGTLPAVIFLCTWQLLVSGDSRREFLFGSPFAVGEVAVRELVTSTFWSDVGTTCCEATLGLLIGSLLGTFLGLALWSFDWAARIARPYLVVLGSIPIFAIAPMLIIWFGIGLLSKVVMSAFAVFFVALNQAYDGAAMCWQDHGSYVRTLAAPRSKIIFKVIIPGAVRWVVAGLKLSVGLALLGSFIGEFVSSERGLGHYILTAGSLYDMPRVLFGVASLSLIALSATVLIWWFEVLRPHLFAKRGS